MTSNHLLNEILEQPAVLRRIYDAYVYRNNPDLNRAADLINKSSPVHMAGMVTSQFGAMPAAGLLNRAGKLTLVHNAAELLYYNLESLRSDSCLVTISQSGESAEIVHLLRKLNGSLPVVGIYNSEDSYLSKNCDIGLPILAGPQLACGTKTNFATIAVMLLLAAAVLEEDLQAAGEKLLAVADTMQELFIDWEMKLTPAADFLEGSPYLIFLGRGPGLVSALFSSVLFREVNKSVAEAMCAADFRHGLLEMIQPEHRVIIFAPSGETQLLCVNLAEDLLNLKIPVMLVTNNSLQVKPDKSFYLIQTDYFPEAWSPLLDMVPLQLVGYLLALRKGLQPGELKIASYITSAE